MIEITEEEYERLKQCEKESDFLKEAIKRVNLDVSTLELANAIGQVPSKKFRDRLVSYGFLRKVGRFYLPDKWAIEKAYCYSLGNKVETTYWTLKGQVEVSKVMGFEFLPFFKDLKI